MKLKSAIASLVFLAHALAGQPLNPNSLVNTNSAYDELNPILSPDGQRLYFTIANHPQNLGGKKDPGDIWFSSKGENGQWTAPVHGGTTLNDRSFNGIAGFSEDGSEVFLLTHYSNSGAAPATQGISLSRNSGGQWTKPENIFIPYFQNKSNIISGYITPDRSTFLYSAETYGSYGVEDLYVCVRKQDGKWSEPRNLGAGINTQFQELAPSLSPDGRTLYFSTNGRKGTGSFDIYSATRMDESWTKWSEPVNMSQVNTEGRDLYFRDFGQHGFSLYTSTKNSDGYGDIRTYLLPVPPTTEEPPVVVNTPPAQTPVIVENKPADVSLKPTVSLYGKVLDSKSGETVPARLSFTQDGGEGASSAINATRDGFSSALRRGNLYSIRIEAPGYISTMEKLDIRSDELNELEMNFRLQPIEVGTTVSLKNVLFEQSKTMLLPQSFSELDLVVSFLKQNPGVSIELSGHTDNRGNPFQNVKLSQARVDAVKEYLVSKGIEGRRISGKGYGGSKPIASNNDEETRMLNRRVEFTIRKN